MKTLVIHPSDSTTDFLSEIYKDTDWTIINSYVSKSFLIQAIKAHSRVVMLGHGTDKGLFDINKKGFIIDSTLVYLLREKECVCIWCDADQFVVKYKLGGLHTGMIISEVDEAQTFCNDPFSIEQIDTSNNLFANLIKNLINKTFDITLIEQLYDIKDNPIIQFNKQNIYS